MRSRAVSRPARNIRSVVSVQRTIEKRFVALLGVVSCRGDRTLPLRTGSMNAPTDLMVNGHGFVGSTTRNDVLPFEPIFTEEYVCSTSSLPPSFVFSSSSKSSRTIANILGQFGVSFDELDAYCESNEWLGEIQQFCLHCSPNDLTALTDILRRSSSNVCVAGWTTRARSNRPTRRLPRRTSFKWIVRWSAKICTRRSRTSTPILASIFTTTLFRIHKR